MTKSVGQPGWVPRSESELGEALAAGLLEETHYLDFKALIEDGKGANKELARDLAQFAIDSGALLIGVAEQKAGPPILAPVILAGLPERIEQVALSSVDAPLYVKNEVIKSEDDAALGYVLVQVAASATAPHMVDGVYYGRGDKTRVRLSDAEVRRLHSQLEVAADQVRAEVRAYAERDPIPTDLRNNAHLYILAVPATPRREMLLEVTGGDDAYSAMHGLVRAGLAAAALPDQFSPSLASATSFQRRQDGAAMTFGLEAGRTVDPTRRSYEAVVEIELSDEGTIRVMTGRFGDQMREGTKVLFESILPTMVRQTVDIAGQVSKLANYGGLWRFAVLASDIAGLPAHVHGRAWQVGEIVVDADTNEYLSTTHAATIEVQSAPWQVTDRLAGRFVRSLGISAMPEVRAAMEPPSASA